jgi:hypothetical protein
MRIYHRVRSAQHDVSRGEGLVRGTDGTSIDPWVIICKNYFGTTPSLARELLRAFVTVCPERAKSVQYALDRLHSDNESITLMRQRLDHASRLLCPADLLRASLFLSKEGGAKRRPDLLQFEEAVLRFVGKDGKWL